MVLFLVAGAVGLAGLAGYAVGKRKERREIANGYVTYHDNGQGTGQYGNIHYGKTGNIYGYQQPPQTGYYNTSRR
jgi:hypothetical protein